MEEKTRVPVVIDSSYQLGRALLAEAREAERRSQRLLVRAEAALVRAKQSTANDVNPAQL